MPFVYNAADEEHTVKAFGNYFNFKPKQLKQMNKDFAHFFASEKAYLGFISLGDEFDDPEYKLTEEGRERLAEATKSGIANRVQFLRSLVQNNQESLKNDLRMANIDSDPAAHISDGELKALEQLGKYQASGEDEKQKRIDKVKELQAQLAKGEA